VRGLLDAMTSGDGVPTSLFTEDAVLDATVPNWRLGRVGADAVAAELSHWFRHPGRLEQVNVHEVDDVVVVEVDLTWNDEGVPHAVHQIHVIRLDGERIATDSAWCGGRWPADLLAQMEAAQVEAAQLEAARIQPALIEPATTEAANAG
jgi:hypothetical protein